MGIGCRKYLKRSRMMPYFHLPLMFLNYYYYYWSQNSERKWLKKELYLCSSSDKDRKMKYQSVMHPQNSAAWWKTQYPPSISVYQEVAAVSSSLNRRLPVSDYNLWSISIIGGVCRDSYSNNYQDWSVSKATSIFFLSLHSSSRGERERLCCMTWLDQGSIGLCYC